MPLFEFLCPICGERLELLARSAETAPPPECPSCATVMSKQFAPVAAHTRGRGAGCAAPRSGFS